MAYKQQDWKSVLHAEEQRRRRQDDRVNKAAQKKQSKIMYERRKLDKAIKQLYNNGPIRYTDVVRIHEQFGIRCFTLDEQPNN